MKTVLTTLACASLILAFALPALFAQDCPPAPVELSYFPDKVVHFPHDAHADLKCQECHHKWDGEGIIKPCADSGCHDNFEAKKGEDSFYNIAHGRGSDEVSSCLGCHREVAKEKKDQRKALTSCMGSACHPK